MSQTPKDIKEKKSSNDEKYLKKINNFGKATKGTVLIVILLTFGLSVSMGSFDIVDSGKVRIAVEPSGNIVGPVEAGWHFGWCSPFSSKYDFQITVQTYKVVNLHADTLDGHVNIDLSVSYILAKENVTAIFQKYGASYQTAIEAVITSAFRDAFSHNSMRSVALDNRSYVQLACKEQIKNGLIQYFVEFHSLQVQNILLPTDFSAAQIKTQIAMEELRAANITHQIKVLEATTAAEVSIISAESLANATIIQAESMAEAMDMVVVALNVSGNVTESHLLTYLYIQALIDYAQYGDVLLITDGSVPVIVDITTSTNTTTS
jgi:regulator of protease activity HflC (stomatin/prohibitin superfamily)